MTNDDADRTKRRLMTDLQRLAPDLAADLAGVADVRELSREDRESIADVLGRECAEHGLDHDELNSYGEELDALVSTLGLDADDED
jgi:hypothetical protein